MPHSRDDRRTELRERLLDSLAGTDLTLITLPETGGSRGKAVLECPCGHQFQRRADTILKWRSRVCPVCRQRAASTREAGKRSDPNLLEWIPDHVVVGRGAKPRDLRGRRFGALVAQRVVGKHERGSLLWECSCDCGNTVTRKSSVLCAGKCKSCGCIWGTAKTYATSAPNTGHRYTLKGESDVFASKKSWAKAVRLARGDACELCGWSEAKCDVHHRLPRSEGGQNTIVNAIVLCPNCHRIAHERGLSALPTS